MSFALLFSGQGHQHPGMLPWLADDAIVHEVCARLGVQDWRLALVDPAWAEANHNAQTLLTGLSLAAWRQIAPLVASHPVAIAGYSVGELAAFSAAGVLDPADTLELAQLRAAVMDDCAAATPGGLLAVTGLSASSLDSLCTDTGLVVAIRNGVDNVILGGPLAGLALAETRATREGAQCTRLRVSVASHTPWMLGAADSFARTLERFPLQQPKCVLFSNAADRIRNANSAAQALSAQIARTVRWDECLENVMAQQVSCVLEIGPGQALARMWNQRYPSIPARACDDFRSAAAIGAWLTSHEDR